jgi:hypothetical protein
VRAEPVGLGEDLGRADHVEQLDAVEYDDHHITRIAGLRHPSIVSLSVGKTARAPQHPCRSCAETGVTRHQTRRRT